MVEIDVADKWQNRNVIEDALLNEDVLNFIREFHGEIIKIEKHFEVGGMETDAILYCRRIKRVRKIGIELKEYDLLKAISQAVARRKFFHYFYVIIRGSRPYIGYDIYSLYYTGKLKLLFENKIGLIIINNEGVWLIFPSHYINIKEEENEKNNKRSY